MFKVKIAQKLVCLVVMLNLSLLFTNKVYAAAGFTEIDSFVDNVAVTNSFYGTDIKVGDINGDGYDDLFVSANRFNPPSNAGRVYAYFGGESYDSSEDFIIDGESEGDTLSDFQNGNSMLLFDIDKDGSDDLVVAAPWRNEYGTSAGKVYVFFGSDSIGGTVSASAADKVFPANGTTKIWYGLSMSFGDFNSDRNVDFAISSPNANSSHGFIHIYHGNGGRDFDTTTEDATIAYDFANRLGADSLEKGDFNGDGNIDLLAGNLGRDAMYIFNGNSFDPGYDYKIAAENVSGENLSVGSASTGDLDNDGISDMCFGAMDNDTYATDSGRVYCFKGGDLNSEVTVLNADTILSGQAAGDNFGRDTYLKDINNDGYLDLVVGAYQHDGSDQGYVTIFFNDGDGNFDFSSSSVLVGVGSNLFGTSVYAGDMNGNGWQEIYVGQSFGGNGSGTTGKVFAYEINHGDPAIVVGQGVETEGNTSTVSGTVTDLTYTVAGVQWSFSNDPTGDWYECIAGDGAFDSNEEQYTCEILDLSGKEQTIYFRSFDENGVFMPAGSYEFGTYQTSDSQQELPDTGEKTIAYVSAVLILLLVFLKLKETKRFTV